LYRDHDPYHERRLEQQTLDALLRIEEILARAFPAKEDDVGLIAGDMIPDGSVKPIETPFFKAAAKGKRK
jgi:hypothetical protein